ncbi:MAG: DUF6273 domain-containing protein [Lachnospiraceae bacterium]|nr:DUF6273 domain-containing protein [Lachnospiraceae bacterium]
MKKLRKAIALLLVELLAMGLFSSLRIEAKEIKLPVPKISVSLAKNGTDVKVTIKKTKSAEGYEVWVKGDMNYNGYKEDVQERLVLAKDKKSMFVVSKFAIDCLPYNIEDKDVTWETCTLRKWLNEEFYKNAFSKSEKSLIKTTTVENYDNAVYNTPGGEDTKDKVFLLSQFEMINKNYGFDEAYDKRDENRCCEPTIYAVAQENTQSIEYIMSEGNWPRRWLRSPGFSY